MKITPEGKVVKVGNEKASYGTMMKIRTMILQQSAKFLGISLTICTRYSLIRRQFKGVEGERQVIDYQTQQNKITPLIANAYAITQAYKRLDILLEQNEHLMLKGDYSMLNAMHCLISGYKSHFTTLALDGLEQCRNACGGHGYLHYSGLPGIMQEFSPTVTYEGENTILYLQTARYLVKAYNRLAKDKPLDQFTSYFKQPKGFLKSQLQLHHLFSPDSQAYLEELSSVESLNKILLYNSLSRVDQAAKKLMQAVMSKQDLTSAWNQKAGISLIDAAYAHTVYMTYSMFQQQIEIDTKGHTRQVMQQLLRLYGIERLLEKPQAVFGGGYLTGVQFRMLRTKVKETLLQQLRPHLLTFVEAFHLEDNTLRSAIGMKNGKPYETLFEWVTQHNPVNKKQVIDNIINHWVGTPIPIPITSKL